MATTKRNILAEIKAANKMLEDCIANGDSAGVAKLYSASPMLMPPNSKVLKTARTIAGWWQEALDMGAKSVTLKTTEADHLGRTVAETGTFTMKGARGKVLDKGSYVVIWKREGKNWKLHRDIFNSDNPA